MNATADLQPMLFDLPPIQRVKADRPLTTRERFELFDAANPQVYARLRDMALAMRRRGVARWGFRAAWEILRWQGMLSSTDGKYRLPNNLAPHYTHLLMEREPELAGFFETRQLRRA
jgi:aminoglycoside phosphotransferase (APT) family kinase protein